MSTSTIQVLTAGRVIAPVSVVKCQIVGSHLFTFLSDGTQWDAGALPPGMIARSIVSTAISTGNYLIVTYSDGTTQNAGPITGGGGRGVASFSIDVNGILSVLYTDGITQIVGQAPKGLKGDQGVPGRGITSIAVQSDNSVLTTYTDLTTQNSGVIAVSYDDGVY